MALALLCCIAAHAVAEPPPVCLVRDGQANAVIVIPSDLPDPPADEKHPLFIEFGLMRGDTRQSAELLAKYIQASAGATLPIVTDDHIPADTNAIHIGRTALARTRLADVAALDDDGFLIARPDASNVILLGATPLATEFAVCDFLEREIGVRWLFPGELGEHVPAHRNLCVAGPDRISQPTYISRIFYLRGRDGYVQGSSAWTRRNRAHSRIEFHHNISKLVPVSWGRSHPEFFPLLNGERYLPQRANQDDWHLCYAADGVAQAMADLLKRNIERYPQYGSISLGVSDGGADTYCQCADCLAARPANQLNSLGYHHYSDPYYRWINDVLDRVTAAHPNMLFGGLAYREVADPPSFQVHDNHVPYLTYELLQWAVPDRREAWRQQVLAWSDKAKRWGHYEYMFGEQYMLIPRIYPHAVADYLRFAAEHGAISFYAETTGMHAHTMSYAGPQAYIVLRLLWDPAADVDALLHDWCAAAVGPEAAPYLEAYFRHCERIWTQQVPQTAWFGSTAQTYLKFNSDEYLAGVRTADLDMLERLLVQTLETAPLQGIQRQRAEMFLADFQERRRERLDYQVAVWDLQKLVDTAEQGDAIYRATFDDGSSGWSAFSSNDTHVATHDVSNGTMRLVGDVSLVAPQIELEPDRAYVVSWRVDADAPYDDARITFVMEGMPSGEPDYKVQRNMRGIDLPDGPHTYQFAFRTQPSQAAKVKLRCAVMVRLMSEGELRLDDVSIAPLSRKE
jgi:hypothetical protein